MQIVPVDHVEVGDRIWGLNDWSTIEAKIFKGDLSVDAVHMNNGSTLTLTPDHHVYVAECKRHGNSDHLAKPCSCPMSDRVEQRVRVSELRSGMALWTPNRIPFGESDLDPDRAYVEGLFVADGWSDQVSRFCISGADGKPKEIQKQEVKRICERLKIATRWHKKYIAVNDREWTLRMQQMGHGAPNKHVLDLNFGEAQAAALLRGVMADSGNNTNGPSRTFSTTSRLLAAQVRVLHKMFGVSTSYRYLEDHGGLGDHPIYRIGVRHMQSFQGRKILRVKGVSRSIRKVPCWDIQTTDHKVYLPEHDVTVSQCDDLAAWRVAELRVRGSADYPNGEPAQFMLRKFVRPGKPLLYHVLVKRAPTKAHPKGWIEDPSKILGMPGNA